MSLKNKIYLVESNFGTVETKLLVRRWRVAADEVIVDAQSDTITLFNDNKVVGVFTKYNTTVVAEASLKS